MKKILLDENKNFYKANMHCHSTNSDGTMTVEEIKEYYKAKGYSVIAFSDAEHLIDNSYLNDEDFLAITACEICIKDINNLSPTSKQCHFNLFAKDPKNVDTPCYNPLYDHYVNDNIKDLIVHTDGNYVRNYSPDGVNEIIKIATEKGFLISYNHPRWSLENSSDYLAYKGLWAIEVYNHACHLGGLYDYDINVYDDFLRSGEKIACVYGDDNHNITNACGGYIMINAENLNYSTIIDALEKHNFYASTGPVIKSLYIEDDMAYITFEKGEYAVISTQGRRVQKQFAQNPDGENTVEFEIHPDDGYIRFDVVDTYGKRANTCAYFI